MVFSSRGARYSQVTLKIPSFLHLLMIFSSRGARFSQVTLKIYSFLHFLTLLTNYFTMLIVSGM